MLHHLPNYHDLLKSRHTYYFLLPIYELLCLSQQRLSILLLLLGAINHVFSLPLLPFSLNLFSIVDLTSFILFYLLWIVLLYYYYYCYHYLCLIFIYFPLLYFHWFLIINYPNQKKR